MQSNTSISTWPILLSPKVYHIPNIINQPPTFPASIYNSHAPSNHIPYVLPLAHSLFIIACPQHKCPLFSPSRSFRKPQSRMIIKKRKVTSRNFQPIFSFIFFCAATKLPRSIQLRKFSIILLLFYYPHVFNFNSQISIVIPNHFRYLNFSEIQRRKTYSKSLHASKDEFLLFPDNYRRAFLDRGKR